MPRSAGPAPRASSARRVVEGVRGTLARLRRTRIGRANARFGAAGGGVLTGGIAYSAVFSVFAALTIGFTVFTAILGGDHALRSRVLATVSSSLPGLIDTGDGRGAISPDSLTVTTGFTVAGGVAAVVLVMSAVSWMAALRTGLRAMFGLPADGANAVAGKLRELAGLAALSTGVLVSAVLSLVLTGAVHWVLGALGLGAGAAWAVRVVGALASLVVDALTFALLVVVLAGVHPPRRDLLIGSLIAGAGLGVVRQLGTSVVAGTVGRNALLASFAVIVTLLVWVNLVARIVLLSAAWVATPPISAPATPRSVGARRE
ncbi:MAG TPA: YihY/virulence factor BrkB family protein [Cellulomonadaceae bacterium]|nr:YihY/virulence factor BrkB family protein [Cellulomonadaceae bacterium]